jgi:uncharacterized protein (DUF1697 family)
MLTDPARRPAVGKQVALIRGINVGRAKRVAMADLRALVESLGCSDVRTLLNSGNIVFTTPRTAPASCRRIESVASDWALPAVSRIDRRRACRYRR